MTTPINNIVRLIGAKSIFESAKSMIDATVSINQGDLVSVAAGLLKTVTASTDAPNFLGVAKQTIVLGKVKSPYRGTAVDAAQALEDIAGPVYGIIASLIMNTGDAFAPGAKVYLMAAGQTVTTTDPGTHDPIGIYQGANVAVAAAGQKGEFLVGARYAMSDLHF